MDTVVVISTDSAPDQLSDVLDPFIHANAANPNPRGKGRAAAGGVLVLVVGGARGGAARGGAMAMVRLRPHGLGTGVPRSKENALPP